MSTAITDTTSQLRRDENEILYEYKDHLGYSTIGIGRLIDKRKGGGISQMESAYLCANDLDRINKALDAAIPWILQLSPCRRGVLVNMAFQMGVTGLLGFKNTLAMVRQGQYDAASRGMLQSLWATQTPSRAYRLSLQMKLDTWQ